ncbi:hypothetical protein Q7A53_05415 [Halobacillus rhizosphaerae]|uniref:Rok-like winged helix domain-containing protein n=1 Tax=Halobacillus rhizosphaerae TaxID=3064889 RepID=UPI00398B5AEF
MSFNEREALQTMLSFANDQMKEAKEMYFEVLTKIREVDERDLYNEDDNSSNEDLKELKDENKKLRQEIEKLKKDKPKNKVQYDMNEVADHVRTFIETHDEDDVSSKEIRDYLAELDFTWANFSIAMGQIMNHDKGIVKAGRGLYAVKGESEG